MKNLQEWLKEHHIDIKESALIERAFIHSSYLNEHPEVDSEDNQRLEFMGDAVLQLWSAHYLYNLKPALNEGQMTKMRASLVNEASLSRMAVLLGLNQFLKLGQGEIRENGIEKPSIVADMFESFLGALYLEKGFEPTIRPVDRNSSRPMTSGLLNMCWFPKADPPMTVNLKWL